VRSSARQPSAIGGGDGCIAIVSEWRSSSTKLIRPKATREERTKLTGVKGEHGGASSIALGGGVEEMAQAGVEERELGRSLL
jgi:hypothetical protein